jgi:predicted nucleotidyltransferase
MITKQQIREVAKRIVESFKPRRIILFGSYATGTPTEESDLDLLIIKDSDVPSRQQNRKVREMLYDLRIPVDVIVKTTEEFQTYKDIVGTVIYPENKFGKVVYESR